VIDINDGRNYARLSDKRYDLITIDSPPPIWSAGAIVLLTQEFYQEASQRLTPGGVMTTFIALHQPQVEKLILRTFRSQFRHMSVVYSPGYGGTFIMGSQAPITFDQATSLAVFGSPAAQADLAGAPNWPAQSGAQWASYISDNVWLTNNQVDAYTGAGPLLTDDHPLTEYFLLNGFGESAWTLVFRLFLVVTGLFALLVIGAAVDAATQRRKLAKRPAA
jgi:spermidine synthase